MTGDTASAPAELADSLARLIRMNGPVSIDEYMRLCLHHPEYGYYRRQIAVGAEADFITAPEISQIFGETLACWGFSVWKRLGEPARCVWVEAGPGRASLFLDLCRGLQHEPAALQAAEWHFIESNPVLKQIQQKRIADFRQQTDSVPVPVWHDDLYSLPDDKPLILIANEFLDCFPARQFVFTDNVWKEHLIALRPDSDAENAEAADGDAGEEEDRTGGFSLTRGPAISPSLAAALHFPQTPQPGEIFEMSSAIVHFSNALGLRLKQQKGAAIVIDYGYVRDAPEYKGRDTWRGVFKHRLASPLERPGLCDLSFEVDFSLLARLFAECGLDVSPIRTQSVFLKTAGAEERARRLKRNAKNREQETQIDTGLARLLDDMGQMFKTLTAEWIPLSSDNVGKSG